MNDVEYLENNIVRVKDFLQNIEQELHDSSNESRSAMVEYRSYQRHLKELQTKLDEAKQEKLVTVG
jgi:chromosome segregation ATPase